LINDACLDGNHGHVERWLVIFYAIVRSTFNSRVP
jgi:hypothetical protein